MEEQLQHLQSWQRCPPPQSLHPRSQQSPTEVVGPPGPEEAGAVEIVVEVLQIQTVTLINVPQTNPHHKNLTKRVRDTAQMSQTMPVLAIGVKAAKLHTALTP